MEPVVCPNSELLKKLEAMRTRYNLRSDLHLFINNFRPTPAAVITDFVEASFPGYLPVALGGSWSAPTVVQLGVAEMRSGPARFRGIGPGFDQPCYGWWIDDLDHVLACRRFDAPATLGPSVPDFVFLVVIQDFARSILPF